MDLLSERPGPAAGSRAEEPADRQQDLHPPPADRGVGQRPGIAAVDPARHRPALRARRRGRPRPGRHEQQPGRDRDLLDDHPGQVRQENAQVNAEPGHDKNAPLCDNDTTDSWKISRLRQPLDYQESMGPSLH